MQRKQKSMGESDKEVENGEIMWNFKRKRKQLGSLTWCKPISIISIALWDVLFLRVLLLRALSALRCIAGYLFLRPHRLSVSLEELRLPAFRIPSFSAATLLIRRPNPTVHHGESLFLIFEILVNFCFFLN